MGVGRFGCGRWPVPPPQSESLRRVPGRGDTLWLVDLLLIDIFVIFFTRAIFQPQGCSRGTLRRRGSWRCMPEWAGHKACVGQPRHRDREQGSDVLAMT